MLVAVIVSFFVGALCGIFCMAMIAAGNNRDEIL